jgi:hypothetical protein
MPKNPKLNIARYKVQGGELNEYDFHKNQQAFVQQHEPESLIPGTPPEQKTPPADAGVGALGESIANVETPPAAKGSRKTTTKKASKKATTKKATTRKTTKKSTKKAKPAKARKASKSRTSKRPTKRMKGRSTKKAAKKSGTKTKARKK